MRVGVITNRNLGSPWASTHFYIYRALRRLGLDVVHVAGKEIANHHTRRNGRRHGGKQPSPFTPALANAVKRDIERCDYDLLLALHASTVIPTLEFSCPLLYVTDATAALLNSYYPQRQKLSEEDSRFLQDCEEITVARSDATMVPTQWAADSLLQDYGAEASRVHIFEWGGNLDSLPDLSETPRVRSEGPLRFLFVGLDWDRKGGDVAAETVEMLQSSGVPAQLTVVGSAIPKEHRSPHVRSVGMLNRANPDESAQLDQLFQSADFYIHPARAECYGHVLCEALGFGVPVLAANTGGVSQCVMDGETGLLVPPETPAAEYANEVRRLLSDANLLEDMRTNAVLDFRQRLNWDCWALRVQQLMQEIHTQTVSTSSD